MRVTRIILRTADLEASRHFWLDVVGLSEAFASEGFAFLDAGEIQLMLNANQDQATDVSMTELVFEVEDFEAEYAGLRDRGVPFEIEPRPVMQEGNRRLLATHFRDPDGHVASLTGWVD